MRHLSFETKQVLLKAIRTVAGLWFAENRCLMCSKESYGSLLCGDCGKKIKLLIAPPKKVCSCCGKPLLSEMSVCTACRNDRVVTSADGLFPVHSYRMSKKLLLFEWKMNDQRCLSPYFAEAVWNKIKENGLEKCVLVPVPPRKGKVWKKGWDQIQEISSFLAYRYGMKVCDCLERYTVVQQKKLDRNERLSNMGGSYGIRKKYMEKKSLPDQVVLLDDVVTTGVTIQTCAQVLKDCGVTKVHVVSIFIVD